MAIEIFFKTKFLLYWNCKFPNVIPRTKEKCLLYSYFLEILSAYFFLLKVSKTAASDT